MKKITKLEMATVITKALFNADEIKGPMMERHVRGYTRWNREFLEDEYKLALKTLHKEFKNRPYKALDNKGRPIITVLAQNAYLARGEVLEQLSHNISRRPLKDKWREGHCALQTDTGIVLYYCRSMGKYVTIPEGGDNA